MCYCGRVFSVTELETIGTLIVELPSANRARLSRHWIGTVRTDLKNMSCRIALLRMQEYCHRFTTSPKPQQ